MKFDKSKVYSALNADKVKVGSKGYFADNLVALRANVEHETGLWVLTSIEGEENTYRFKSSVYFAFFYLVEEPKSKSSSEIKEVTAVEWDNRPRIMKVWDNFYVKAKETRVLAILDSVKDNINYPVVTLINDDGPGHITCFKHCAEIDETKEPETKKHYRPYKDSDEMIKDFKKRYNSYGGWSGKNNPMYCPLIWLKNVYSQEKELVRYFFGNYVYLNNTWTLEELLDKYTYLDGTPVGMEE